MSSERAAHFRELAAECLMVGANTTDRFARDALFEKARVWLELADENESASNAPRGNSQTDAQPITQQRGLGAFVDFRAPAIPVLIAGEPEDFRARYASRDGLFLCFPGPETARQRLVEFGLLGE
jgi:hypothetical protein